LGGFACGTVSGANTRRYHGLLVAALRPPVERTVMVSKIDIAVRYLGERIELGTNEYADGTIAPRGYQHLHVFKLEGQTPVWQWVIRDALIEQRIWMAHGKNTTYVSLEVLRASASLEFEVAPLCTYRDYHWQLRGARDFQVNRVAGGIEIRAFEGAVPYRMTSQGEWFVAPDWHWNFRHRAESERGLDDVEDLLRPATLQFTLKEGQSRAVTVTAERDEPQSAAESYQHEIARQNELLELLGAGIHNRRTRPDTGASVDTMKELALAADQFIVARQASNATEPSGSTVIAGYPWFSD